MNYTKENQKEIADYLNAVRKNMQGAPEEEIDEVILHLQEQIDVAVQESGEAANQAGTVSSILSAMSHPESFAQTQDTSSRDRSKGPLALTLTVISLVLVILGFPFLVLLAFLIPAIVLAVMNWKTVLGKVAIGILLLEPILYSVIHYVGVVHQ